MKKTLFLPLSILLFGSCTNKERSDEIVIYTFEQMKHANPLGKTFPIDWERIEYVPLETNDSCLIAGFPKKVILTEDKIFVTSRNNLYVFDRRGKFLHRIGKVGQGPEDYTSIRDNAINREERICYVGDNNKKITAYSYDNRFLYSFRYNENITFQHMEYFDKELFYTGINLLGQDRYKIKSLSTEGDSLYASPNHLRCKIPEPRTSITIYGIPKSMQVYRDELILHQIYNDTIFTYRNRETKVRYIFDFADMALPVEGLLDLGNAMKNCIFINDVTETVSRIFVALLNREKDEKYLIDKKSRTVYKADNAKGGINIPDTPLFFWPTFYSDHCAIGILAADKIFNEKTDEIRDKRLKPMIDKLNEESNPILVIYKE